MEENELGEDVVMEPSMMPTDETLEEGTKVSYEQLEQIARQAVQQAGHFREQLMRVQEDRLYTRLDFLFKVLETRSKMSTVFTNEFVYKCTNEIESLLTLPEQPNKKDA